MKKTMKILAIFLAVSVMFTAGCSLVSVNTEKDLAQVIAEIGNYKVLKKEYVDMFNQQYSYYQSLYSQYGMSIDDDTLESIKTSSFDSLLSKYTQLYKADELGLSTLSDEEKATVEAAVTSAMDDFEAYIQSLLDQEAQSDPTLDKEKRAVELRESVLRDEADMTQKEYEDFVRTEETSEIILNKLRAHYDSEVSITDADLQEWYDTRLEEETAEFTETPASYKSAMDDYESGGEPVTFAPDGYIRVKHILLKPEGTIPEVYTNNKTTIETLSGEMATLIAASETENQVRIDEIRAEIAKLREEGNAARDAWLETARPRVDEVLAKLQAGEGFDALIETYNEDDGMKSEPYKSRGYLMSADTTDYMEEFKNASLKLAFVGAVSEPTITDYGFHIIKLIEKVKAGAVPLNDIKGDVSNVVTAAKQEEYFSTTLSELIETFRVDGTLKTYDERLTINE